MQEGDRTVLGHVANAECLPYTDSTFDCYLSNLCILYVNKPDNMLREALRVCKPGAGIGFTTWGRRDNIQHFEVLTPVLAKYGLPPYKDTPYELGRDPELMRQRLEGLGFCGIRVWYQHMNFSFTPEEYLDQMKDTIASRNAKANLAPEIYEAYLQDLKAEFEKRAGPTVLDIRSIEVMVVIATKP